MCERLMARKTPLAIVKVLTHCPPRNKQVPNGNTLGARGPQERDLPPYLTMPTIRDTCPLQQALLNVRRIVYGTNNYLQLGMGIFCYRATRETENIVKGPSKMQN